MFYVLSDAKMAIVFYANRIRWNIHCNKSMKAIDCVWSESNGQKRQLTRWMQIEFKWTGIKFDVKCNSKFEHQFVNHKLFVQIPMTPLFWLVNN